MRCTLSFAACAGLTLLLVGPSSAQQSTSSAPPLGTLGTQTPSPGMVPFSQGAVIQSPGQPTPGTAGQYFPANVQAPQGQSGMGFAPFTSTQRQAAGGQPGAPGQLPWFSTPDAKQYLKLDNAQDKKLQKAYADAYNQYQSVINSLDGLNVQQRAGLMQEAAHQFRNAILQPPAGILTQPQLERYQILTLQNRGYGSFADPAVVQTLKLNNVQLQKLAKFGADYNTQLNKVYQTLQTNPAAANQQYQNLMQQQQNKVNSVFTPQQRAMWGQMTGQPGTFNPGLNPAFMSAPAQQKK
jgi:hypothetical protein